MARRDAPHLVALLSGGAGAQGAPQTVELAKVDVQKLAAGYRASKVIGSSVVNDANETIGKIDDLLVSPDGKEPYAVLSIGGFLVRGPFAAIPTWRCRRYLPISGTESGD